MDLWIEWIITSCRRRNVVVKLLLSRGTLVTKWQYGEGPTTVPVVVLSCT